MVSPTGSLVKDRMLWCVSEWLLFLPFLETPNLFIYFFLSAIHHENLIELFLVQLTDVFADTPPPSLCTLAHVYHQTHVRTEPL